MTDKYINNNIVFIPSELDFPQLHLTTMKELYWFEIPDYISELFGKEIDLIEMCKILKWCRRFYMDYDFDFIVNNSYNFSDKYGDIFEDHLDDDNKYIDNLRSDKEFCDRWYDEVQRYKLLPDKELRDKYLYHNKYIVHDITKLVNL